MAKGRKTGGRNFQKGYKPPGGRPKAPDDIVKVRGLTNTEFQAVLNYFLTMDREELKQVAEAPGTPMLRVIMANLILKAGAGDQFRLEFILNRLIGKVPDQPKEVNLNFNMLPREQVIDLGRQAVTYLEENTDDEEFTIDE
jgi:hypothetical protein